MKSEDRLLYNLKKKKRNSLEDVIKLYTPYVSVIVYNTIGSVMTKEDAEEVISDSFLALWRHIDSVSNEKGGIRTYLGAIARNIAKNKLREYKTHDVLDENTVSNFDDPREIVLKNEEKIFLADMIIKLGEPDSEIFFRYYYYNEKIRDIASVTGIPISTVKTKLSRGKNKLKQIISSKEGLQ